LQLTISNSFDYSKENGGNSFKDRHARWQDNPMMKDFSKWGADSFGEWLFCPKKNALMR
jgi:hypothetical protein